jgi:DNA-binding response OmpR family regulator
MVMSTPVQTRCLIIEDQALIAMGVETYLEDAGFEVQTATSIAQAQACLKDNAPEFVILDFMLRDGPATAIAGELQKRGIPFIVYSGYSRHLGMSCEFDEVPWIEKPTSLENLLKAVVTLSLKSASIAALNS